METIVNFIKNNISAEPYQTARFAIESFYPLILNPDKLSKYEISRAVNDLTLFSSIECERLKIKNPLVGDYILRPDGRKTRIGIFTYGGNFQDTEGSCFYLTGSGGSFSGGFTMDVLNVNNLTDTGLLEEAKGWIFSGGHAGGNRGVNHKIKVRVWKQKEE